MTVTINYAFILLRLYPQQYLEFFTNIEMCKKLLVGFAVEINGEKTIFDR